MACANWRASSGSPSGSGMPKAPGRSPASARYSAKIIRSDSKRGRYTRWAAASAVASNRTVGTSWSVAT